MRRVVAALPGLILVVCCSAEVASFPTHHKDLALLSLGADGAVVSDDAAVPAAESVPYDGLGDSSDPNALEALPTVPDDIECYHELVEKVQGIETRLADQKDQLHLEGVKFNHTSEVKATALHKVQNLEADAVKQRAAMDESKEAYKKEHTAALSMYELARASLNHYNDFKKQSDDDTTRSQEDMAAYLKYKELALKATDEGDDRNMERYQRMSDKYLESYKALEASLKDSLSKAKQANEDYQTLSSKYDDATNEVKALEVTAEQTRKVFETTNTELEHQKAVYDQAVQDSSDAQEKFDEIQNKLKLSTQELEDGQTEQMVTNRKFQDLDIKLKQLQHTATTTVQKVGKYREIKFQFESGSREYGEQATTQEQFAEGFADKFEAASAASSAFSDAYQTSGCGTLPHQAAAKKARLDQMSKAKQAAGIAVQLAADELAAADKVRKAASAHQQAAQSSAEDLLGDSIAPGYKIRFEEFVNRFHHHNELHVIGAGGGEAKREHKNNAARAHRSLILLLQEQTSQKDQYCEKTKEIGQLDYHAMEAAEMERDHHAGEGRALRKKQQSNLSGVTSTTVILKNLETRVSNLKREVTAVQQRRQHPCVTPPDSKIKSK